MSKKSFYLGSTKHLGPSDEEGLYGILEARSELIATGDVPEVWSARGILPGEILCLFLLMGQRMSVRLAAKQLRRAVRGAGEADNWPTVLRRLRQNFVSHPVPLDEECFRAAFTEYAENFGPFEKVAPEQIGNA
jgi:hypothetical protein